MWCPDCNSECGPVNAYKCDCGHYKSKHVDKSASLPPPAAAAGAPPTTPKPLVASASFAAPRPSLVRPRLVVTPVGVPAGPAIAPSSAPELSPKPASSSMSIPRPRLMTPRATPAPPTATPSTGQAVTPVAVSVTPEPAVATDTSGSTTPTGAAAASTAPVVTAEPSGDAGVASPKVPPKRIVNPGAISHSPSTASMSFALPPRPDTAPPPPPRMRDSSSVTRPSLPPRERDEATVKRHRELVTELINTEQALVQSLTVLQAHYMPILDQVHQNESSFGAQPTDVASLELPMFVLLSSHNLMLQALKEAEVDDCLAVVCKHASVLAHHTEYLDKYESAIAILFRLKQNKKFKKLLEEFDQHFRLPGSIIILDEGESGMAILDHLLLPSQKLFALASLLTEINKRQPHKPVGEPYAKLLEGLSALRERMGQCEMTKQILGIQGMLKDVPVAFAWPPSRTLARVGKLVSVMETTSKKSATMRAQDRVVYLFSDKLLVARKEHYLYDLSIASVSIEPGAGTDTDFIVSNSSASVCFRCEDAEERNGWIKDLESAKDAAKENRRQKQATLRPGPGAVSQHISEELEKLTQDPHQDGAKARVKVSVRIPGHFFEKNKSEVLSLLITPENSVEIVIEMAVKWARRLPSIHPDNLLPSKFGLFKLEGKEPLDETQPVYPQTSSGGMELTLDAHRGMGEEWKAPERGRESSNEVVKEIIGVEQHCMQSLIALRTTYLSALLLIQKEESSYSALPGDVSALELNVAILYELHLEMFTSLQACTHATEVIQVVGKYAPTFSCHVDYLDKVEVAAGVVERLKQKTKFKKWLEGLEKQFDNKPLVDYLLIPIQKVCSFLETLQACPGASEANVAKVLEIGSVLTERTKKMEDYKKVRDVQALLKDVPKDFGWPFSRSLVRIGKIKAVMETLSKKAQSLKMIDRTIYLFSDKIVVTKKEPSFLYDASISALTVEIITETETDFTITTSTLSVCFRCENADERRDWVRDINAVKEAAKDNRRKRSPTPRTTISNAARAQDEIKMALEANQEPESSEETDLKLLVSNEALCVKALSSLESNYLPAIENLRKKDSELAAEGTTLDLNIVALVGVHDRLLKGLQESGSVQEAVAMISNKAVFASHVDYLDRFEAAMLVLEKLKQKSKLKKFIDEVDKQLGDSVAEELLRPISKFLAVVETAGHYDAITKEFANTLAERKTRIEETKKVTEVQSILKDVPKDFLWPQGRTLVRSGPMKSTMENFSKRKQSLRVTDRIVYLFSDKLVVTKKDNAFLFDANLASLNIDSVPELLTDLSVANSTLSVGFRCDTPEEASSWLKELQRASNSAKESRRSQTRGVNPLLMEFVQKLDSKEAPDAEGEEDPEISQALKQDTAKVQNIQAKVAAIDQFQINWRKRAEAHVVALKSYTESSRLLAESLKDLSAAVASGQPVVGLAEQFQGISTQDLVQDVSKGFEVFPGIKQLDLQATRLREKLRQYEASKASYCRAVKEKSKVDEAKNQYERSLSDLESLSGALLESQLTPMLQQALKIEILEMGTFSRQQSSLSQLEAVLRDE